MAWRSVFVAILLAMDITIQATVPIANARLLAEVLRGVVLAAGCPTASVTVVIDFNEHRAEITVRGVGCSVTG